jgi:transposase
MAAPFYQELPRENQQLREHNARLEQTVRELQQRLELLERGVKRQAAPLSKGEPKKRPQDARPQERRPTRNRKVWGGNRTKAGGKAQAFTSSVVETCRGKAIDMFEFIGNAFRGIRGSLFNRPTAVIAKLNTNFSEPTQ